MRAYGARRVPCVKPTRFACSRAILRGRKAAPTARNSWRAIGWQTTARGSIGFAMQAALVAIAWSTLSEPRESSRMTPKGASLAPRAPTSSQNPRKNCDMTGMRPVGRVPRRVPGMPDRNGTRLEAALSACLFPQQRPALTACAGLPGVFRDNGAGQLILKKCPSGHRLVDEVYSLQVCIVLPSTRVRFRGQGSGSETLGVLS
eukprot:3934349-Rhodomonas_salina.2